MKPLEQLTKKERMHTPLLFRDVLTGIAGGAA